ncbi:MAG: GDP-L-fucose synthase [Prolixibacteraceae bacterium]|nr:GDP-L-fucose synthase [Prolixibacteraceae bacterium]
MEKNSKIYVAGHKGLVGSALWKTLQNKGYTNLIGRTINELDLMDAKAVNDFFEKEKPEYVILAAAKVGGIIANNTYRGQFIYENLMIQNNVIHQAYLAGVKKLLFLGSTCIYPREAPQPMPEDCLLTSPLEYTNEPYAIAKIAGIKMCESYNLQYGTNFLSVMPTNLYGPNDNFNLETSHVLPALIRKIHLGKCLETNNWEAIRTDLNTRPIEGINGKATNEAIETILSKYGVSVKTHGHASHGHASHGHATHDTTGTTVEIWGTGAPMREFLWSEEMAEACVYVMENVNFNDVTPQSTTDNRQQTTEVRNTHINIGTGKEVSIKQVAELIKEKVGFKGELYFNTSKPDGTMKKLTDPSKIHALGWHHKIEIDEGIERMYKWYSNNQ